VWLRNVYRALPPAGAAALGGGGAYAQSSGEDFLPDIVAHVTFKVDGKEITKDINLGTTYKSPGEASEALEKFLKSKGIQLDEDIEVAVNILELFANIIDELNICLIGKYALVDLDTREYDLINNFQPGQ
jgi:hypothetical protein